MTAEVWVLKIALILLCIACWWLCACLILTCIEMIRASDWELAYKVIFFFHLSTTDWGWGSVSLRRLLAREPDACSSCQVAEALKEEGKDELWQTQDKEILLYSGICYVQSAWTSGLTDAASQSDAAVVWGGALDASGRWRETERVHLYASLWTHAGVFACEWHH